MKKIFILIALVLFLFNVGFVLSHGEETFATAEEIIKQKISCDELSKDQLEILGDYYMEQMHPGELHEIMDEKMGGEGSESLRAMHIRMGEAFYCGEHNSLSGEMMDMMMGRGMMGSYGNMMGNSYYGSRTYGWRIFGWTVATLVIVALVLLIIWLIRQLQKPKHRR